MNKNKIEELVAQCLKNSELFPVAVLVKPNNIIIVIIDSDSGVTIDDCVKVSRFIEGSLNRDQEDFELRVMSAGADTPFVTERQFQKHIGKEIRVVLHDGSKEEGVLVKKDDKEIVLEIAPAMKKGQKPGKNSLLQQKNISLNDIKEAKAVISF